jgi:small subunit ribosomal protein S9
MIKRTSSLWFSSLFRLRSCSNVAKKSEEKTIHEIKLYPTSKTKGECDIYGRYYATGKRKTSIARVWVKEGSGEIEVNHKPFIEYFGHIQREELIKPFLETQTAGLFDVWCTVKGGGISGQAGAIRLGISKALESISADLRPALKSGDFANLY